MPSISVPAAVIGSSVLGAGASLIGGSQQASAAKGAQNTQLAMFNQTQQNLSPFIQAGQGAISGLQGLLGLPASSSNTPTSPTAGAAGQMALPQGNAPALQQGGTGNALGIVPGSFAANADNTMLARLAQTPGYQFALQQGLLANQFANAGQGLIESGPEVKGAINYAEGLASTTYGQQVQNFSNLVGMGQNAAAGLGSLGQTAASQAGQFGTSGAAAGAAGLMGASNALGGGAINSAFFSSPAGQNLLTNQTGAFGGSSGGSGQYTSGPAVYGGPQGFVTPGAWSPQGYAY